MIHRRRFVAGAAAAPMTPPPVGAEQTGKVYRVGFLGFGAPEWKDSALVAAFRQALGNEGWIEGQNIVIEYRWANDDARRLPMLALELMRVPVDVIFAAGSNITASAARDATLTTPIVMESAVVHCVREALTEELLTWPRRFEFPAEIHVGPRLAPTRADSRHRMTEYADESKRTAAPRQLPAREA